MGRKLIWRAVASAPGHEEVHVFVDASDRAEAKKHLYQRLAEEWRCSVNRITFHNMWNENELREMSTGPREPEGLPLLESGGGTAGFFMTMSRCSLLPPGVSAHHSKLHSSYCRSGRCVWAVVIPGYGMVPVRMLRSG